MTHQEIFSFQHMKGRNKGKEYDLLVKPVVAKWARYLDLCYGEEEDAEEV